MAKTIEQLAKENPRGANEAFDAYEARLSSLYNSQTTPTTQPVQPVQPTQPVQPIQPPAPTTPQLIGLRDAATKAGLNVGWDAATGVTLNGNRIDTTGLINYGTKPPAGYAANTYYGTQEQINNILSPYVYTSPFKGEMQGAYEDYNEWLKRPYVSQYAPMIESLVQNILSRTFQYDPANDAQFQKASKELTRNILETMNARGILSSTVTQNQIQQGLADLMPQYEQIARQQFQDEGNRLMSQVDMLMGLDNMAYGRYQDEGARLASALDTVMRMDEIQYQKWRDAYERRYQAQQDEIAQRDKKIEQERQKIRDAWDRTNELGYVDNESSIILGVPAGTLSKQAREDKIRREQELEDQETQLKHQKELAAYQYSLSQKLAAQKDATTAAPEALGNEQQVKSYYDEKRFFFNIDPLEAYNLLVSNSRPYIDAMGQKLYNKLVSEIMDNMKVQKTYGAINASTTATVDDYAATINSLYITKADPANGIPAYVDKEGIKAYLDQLIMSGVDDSIIDSLAARYGIQ